VALIAGGRSARRPKEPSAKNAKKAGVHEEEIKEIKKDIEPTNGFHRLHGLKGKTNKLQISSPVIIASQQTNLTKGGCTKNYGM